MAYESLNDFIYKAEQSGLLARIHTKVSPLFEISEIADRFVKNPDRSKAFLFENTGTDFPVLINMFGSDDLMQFVLGTDHYDILGAEIEELFHIFTRPKKKLRDKLKMIPELLKINSYKPKTISGKAPVQEIIERNPDLTRLPVLTTWSKDGGPFITLPQVITKDLRTGIRNVGMYRMQIFGKDTCGMHWHRHKTGAKHFSEYQKAGAKMPIAVALGGDPVLTYSATAPLPENIDEYFLAGFLRKKGVRLVKAITQNLDVPADADFIIEGYIDPTEEFVTEGPFGDHTGFFSLPDKYPLMHITCITHRKNAVFPATVVGIPPMEDAYIAKATERIFLPAIKLTLAPEIEDLFIPEEGVAHNLTLISIRKQFPGHAGKMIQSLWGNGQMMFNKMMLVFDGDIDIHNYLSVARTFSGRVVPDRDIHFAKGPLDVLDHSSTSFSYGSKIGFDCTAKMPEETGSRGNETKEGNERNEFAIDTLKLNLGIFDINTELLNMGISVVFISIEKTKSGQFAELCEKIRNEIILTKVKFIIIVDFFVDIHDLKTTVWYFSNNMEPLRDCKIYSEENGKGSQLFIDGTMKTKKYDNFARPWPDVVTSDTETRKIVDNKWNDYNIGDFLESPSKKYSSMSKSSTAEINENE